ncbi:MAG: hypothetical protein KKE83_12055 [Proteobacteria bacterium]|nr:hypothetical protein [Pseudomonadota bacterium]MBU1546030.1 hypothetical protein [Pseudomonadota bacterium]MBU2620405.1 hypothetical protein [Pseudomonadota bacterium]
MSIQEKQPVEKRGKKSRFCHFFKRLKAACRAGISFGTMGAKTWKSAQIQTVSQGTNTVATTT